MHIVDLSSDDPAAIEQTASLLLEAFRSQTPSWPDMASALDEVHESFAVNRLSRVAREADGTVVGWIGGIQIYSGRVWEVHPLAVHPDRQHQGIGRALLSDLEDQARERGGLTLWAGSDDEVDLTSLGDIDLFPDPLTHLTRIRNTGGHPFEFYLRCGFVLAGVLPDANGFGKPDIFLAKRIGSGPTGG